MLRQFTLQSPALLDMIGTVCSRDYADVEWSSSQLGGQRLCGSSTRLHWSHLIQGSLWGLVRCAPVFSELGTTTMPGPMPSAILAFHLNATRSRWIVAHFGASVGWHPDHTTALCAVSWSQHCTLERSLGIFCPKTANTARVLTCGHPWTPQKKWTETQALLLLLSWLMLRADRKQEIDN